MTDTDKPTIGPWKIDPTDLTCVISGSLQSGVGDIVCLSPSEGGFEESAKHWEANAELIIEAGTVYHETGLTPRQLVEQRDGLLSTLKFLQARILSRGDWDEGCFYFSGRSASELQEPLELTRAIIAKVEAKP